MVYSFFFFFNNTPGGGQNLDLEYRQRPSTAGKFYHLFLNNLLLLKYFLYVLTFIENNLIFSKVVLVVEI